MGMEDHPAAYSRGTQRNHGIIERPLLTIDSSDARCENIDRKELVLMAIEFDVHQ